MAEVTSSSLVGSTLFFPGFAGKRRELWKALESVPGRLAAVRQQCNY
jgi:hypothetical protein